MTKLQTHLTPPLAGQKLDLGGGCPTGTQQENNEETTALPRTPIETLKKIII